MEVTRVSSLEKRQVHKDIMNLPLQHDKAVDEELLRLYDSFQKSDIDFARVDTFVKNNEAQTITSAVKQTTKASKKLPGILSSIKNILKITK